MTRVRLFDLPLDLFGMQETLDRIEMLITKGGVHQHVVLNASKVVQAQTNQSLAAAIAACDIVNADGMSVVWAGRLLGMPVPERVAGIDLMDELLQRASMNGWPVYFLGGKQEVVSRVADIECELHPGLIVAGYHNGYWPSETEDRIVAEISATVPVILFVAMPSPTKEQFLARHREVLNVPFVMGVGGSFDVVAGVTKRAPTWMQHAGLEWFYRLMQEPRRLAWRYVAGNVQFVILFLKHLLHRHSR